MIGHGWFITKHPHDVIDMCQIGGPLTISFVRESMTLSIHGALMLVNTPHYLYRKKDNWFCKRCSFLGFALGTVSYFKGTLAFRFLGWITLALKKNVGMELLGLVTRDTMRTTNLTLGIDLGYGPGIQEYLGYPSELWSRLPLIGSFSIVKGHS